MDRYSIALNKKPLVKDALCRAKEFLKLNRRTLPTIALGYLYHLNIKYGACAETSLIALAHYAQAVENLKTSNQLYKINMEGLNWFKNPVPARYDTCPICGDEELISGHMGNKRSCANCDLPF